MAAEAAAVAKLAASVERLRSKRSLTERAHSRRKERIRTRMQMAILALVRA